MKEIMGQIKVRDATVAGIFYPDDPPELEARVSALLDAARPEVSGAKAILSPHAGLDYSGDLSALAWKSAAARQVDTVLILSPLHRAEESVVYLPEADYFDMPTGRVIVDRQLVGEMRDCGTSMRVNDIPHFEEHGIELQLPFMLSLFPAARLVPVLLGRRRPWSRLSLRPSPSCSPTG
jgi:MEMO1 family protein